MRKRIGIVGEGPTDYLVLKCMIDQITGEENEYLRIQPEQNAVGEFGNGWKGVWNWCESTADQLDNIMNGLLPTIDLIIIQMDGDVARKEKEIHCMCSTVHCVHKGKVSPLHCENVRLKECPVDIPCRCHGETPDSYRKHLETSICQWLKINTDRKDMVITIPCDSTDTWIVAAFEKLAKIEYIENPWEDIISKKKEYHGIRIPGHKKSNRVYQQFMPILEQNWEQVVEQCDSAKSLQSAILKRW